MPIQSIEFEGETHEFPDDFTEEEIQGALSGPSAPKPFDAGEALKKGVVGTAKRLGRVVTEDVPDIYKSMKAFQEISGDPVAQGKLLLSMGKEEGERMAASARRSLEAMKVTGDPMTAVEQGPEVLAGAVGALPLVGAQAAEGVESLYSGDPERIATSATDIALNLAPTGRLRVPAGVRRALKLRESRVKSVGQAIGGSASDVPFIEKNLDIIDVPVGTRGRIERITARSRKEAGEQLAGAKERLSGDIEKQALVEDIPSHTRVHGGREVSGDPQLAQAAKRRRQAIEEQYGDDIELSEVASRKKDVQGVADRGKLYDQTPGGPAIGAQVVAAGDEASALRRAIEKAAEKGDQSAKDYLRASEASHVSIGVNEPVLARRNAMLAAGSGQGAHGMELAGRAGAGMSRQVGGQQAAAALVGLKISRFTQSPLWASMSARVKKNLITVLELKGFDAFRNEVARVAVLEARRRREAERVVNKQGEGVVEP